MKTPSFLAACLLGFVVCNEAFEKKETKSDRELLERNKISKTLKMDKPK